MIFTCPYKRHGVEKGDERTVTGIDPRRGTVHPADARGKRTPWRPGNLAAAKGEVEVYRSETVELHRGDPVQAAAALGLTPSESRSAALPSEGRSVPECGATNNLRPARQSG